MEFSKDYNDLGKIIIEKFRDESFKQYLMLKDYSKSISKEEYYELPRNPNIDIELQKNEDERFEFLISLNDKQIEYLDKLVLMILDFTSFNILREIEENLDENESLGLTINGNKVENISNELLSGTLFGEYFLWIDKNSKYGKYQY